MSEYMIGRMRDDLDIFKSFSSVQLRTILEWLLDLGEKIVDLTHMIIKNVLLGYHY